MAGRGAGRRGGRQLGPRQYRPLRRRPRAHGRVRPLGRACHLASFLAGQGGGSLDGARGGALLSGIYDLAHRSDLERTYYGNAPGETVSTLPALLDCPVPLLFSVAERDTRYFHAQAAGVVAAWLARHGVTPQLVWVEGHNHISEIASLGVDDDALGTQLCRFIERVTEPALAPPSARWH